MMAKRNFSMIEYFNQIAKDWQRSSTASRRMAWSGSG